MQAVAIITRTKERNFLLRRAIESALKQTFTDWLMVIVNDGGNKEAVEKVVKEYEDRLNGRVQLIHHDKCMGMEAASNKGIKSSKSKYVVIHDDDDSWHHDFLKETIQALEAKKYPNVKGVVTRTMAVYEKVVDDEIIIEKVEPFNPWMNTIDLYKIWGQNFYPPISFIYAREVFDEIGYYREDLPVLGDWDFNIRFLSKFNIYVLREDLANYHFRYDSTGVIGNSMNGTNEKIEKGAFYESYLRNEYLREDIKNNKLGIGFVVNMSKNFAEISNQINNFNHTVHLSHTNSHELLMGYNRLRKNRLLKFFYSLMKK